VRERNHAPRSRFQTLLDPQLVIPCWIPVSALFFALFPPVRAVILAYLAGWLLMPAESVPIPGFWDFDRVLATNVGVILGTIVFCPERVKNYRFRMADAWLVLFCGSGLAASLSNHLGTYDGLSRFTYLMFFYGAPYLAGRLFLRTKEDLHDAARLVVLSAACYAVLALWEWRMSPGIHQFVYGSFQHAWEQHARWGFWRPIVFFPHALALGAFFVWTSLLGVWMFRCGALGRKDGVPGWVIAGPVLGLLSSMSFGPWGMFIAGLGCLFCWQALRFKWVAALPVVFAVAWMGMRYTGASDANWLLSTTAGISRERATSLEYRILAEKVLVAHARKQPVFGWGTWGRNRVFTEEGKDAVHTDGLWVVILGTSGLFGLTTFYLWWCWPVVMGLLARGGLTDQPAKMAMLIASGVQAVSFLFNGFVDPVMTLICGSLVTLLGERRPQPARRIVIPRSAIAGGPPTLAMAVRCPP